MPTLQFINTGTGPNAGNGDPLRIAFNKVNSNFGLLAETSYSFFNGSATLVLNTSGSVVLTNGSTLFEDTLGNFYIGSSNTGTNWEFKTNGATVFPPGYTFPANKGSAGQTLVLESDAVSLTWQTPLVTVSQLNDNGYTARLDSGGTLVVPQIIEGAGSSGVALEATNLQEFWWSQYGDLSFNTHYDRASGSLYDPAGNLYVIGSITTGTTSTNEIAVLVKYDPDGNLLWDNAFNVSAGTGSTELIGESLATDSYGNIFALANSNGYIIILKFDNNGNLNYQKQFVEYQYSYGTDIAVDSNNNVYVLGDESVIGAAYTSTGYFSFITKFDNNLNPLWSRGITLGNNVNEPYQGSGAGSIVVSGNYVYANGGINDGTYNWQWTAKLDLNGNQQWLKDSQGLIGMGLAVDTIGSVYSACTSDEEGGSSTLIKYKSTGSIAWISHYNQGVGGGDVDLTYATDGYLYATGAVYSTGIRGTKNNQSSLLHWAKVDPSTGNILVERVFGNTNTNYLVGSVTGVTTSTSSVIVTVVNNFLPSGTHVTFTGVGGTTQLNGNNYYIKPLNYNQFRLYYDSTLTNVVTGTFFSAYTTGGSLTMIVNPGTEDVWYYRGHKLSGVYKNALGIAAYSYISTNTSNVYTASNFLTLQLLTNGATTGTYGVYNYGYWKNPYGYTNLVTTTNYLTSNLNLFLGPAGTQPSTSSYVVANNTTVTNTYTAFTMVLGTTGTTSLWQFAPSGTLTFPDGSIQTTAYVNSTGTINLSAITQSIIPASNNTYDLGSPTNQWQHLFISSGSIYLGNIKLSNSADGKNLLIQNVNYTVNTLTNVITTETVINNYAASVSTSSLVAGTWTAVLNKYGNLSLPYGSSIGSPFVDGSSALVGAYDSYVSLVSYDTRQYISVYDTYLGNHVQIGVNYNVPGQTGYSWSFNPDGTTLFASTTTVGNSASGGYKFPGTVGTSGQVLALSSTSTGTLVWTTISGGSALTNGTWTLALSSTGNLTVPNNIIFPQSKLGSPNINGTTDYIRFYDFGAEGTQYNYAMGAEGSHIWFNVDQANNDTLGFKFYGGGTLAAKITTAGNLYINGIKFNDNTTQTTAWKGSTSTLVSGTYTVALSSNVLNIPGPLEYPYGTSLTEVSNLDSQLTAPYQFTINTNGGSVQYTFGNSGYLGLPSGLVFPDSSVQTTAYTGTIAYSNVTGAPYNLTTATVNSLIANSLTNVTNATASRMVFGNGNITQVTGTGTSTVIVSLTVSSSTYFYSSYTGAIVYARLPPTNTLQLGAEYVLDSASSTLYVQNSTGSLLYNTYGTNSTVRAICINTATDTAASWKYNVGYAQFYGNGTGLLTNASPTMSTPTFTGGATFSNAALTLSGTLYANSPGFLGMPQNAQTGSTYTLVLTDQGKHVYVSTTTTVTIPANTVTSFPVGSTVAIIAGPSTTATIAIQSDTLYLGGTGSTGTRTLAPFGMATLVKVTNTTWFISGSGLT